MEILSYFRFSDLQIFCRQARFSCIAYVLGKAALMDPACVVIKKYVLRHMLFLDSVNFVNSLQFCSVLLVFLTM